MLGKVFAPKRVEVSEKITRRGASVYAGHMTNKIAKLGEGNSRQSFGRD
jgi:hypothetical protein